MITLPPNVQEALTAPVRSISARIELEVGDEFVDITPTLIDFYIEESVSEGALPYGQITYNELQVNLDNLDKRYMLNNTSSIYYGKLVALKRIRVTYIIEYEEDVYYELPLHDYYVDSWKATTESGTAVVTAFDELYKLGEQPLVHGPIHKDIAIGRAFQELFALHGIKPEQYMIEPGIAGTLQFWWPTGETLTDSLQALAEVGGVNVFCDKRGLIRITPIWKDTPSVIDLTDSNVLISTKASPTYTEAYSDVDIKYSTFERLEIIEVYSTDLDIDIGAGATLTKSFACKSTPVLDIISIVINNCDSVRVTDFVCQSDTCIATFVNSSKQKVKFGVRIYGRRIDTVSEDLLTHTEGSDANNLLTINTDYIMADQQVIRLATHLREVYKGQIATLEIEVRALPNLELYDRVLLDSSYTGINAEFYVTKLSFDYADGLMGTMTLSASVAAKPQGRVFISPGLSILVKEDVK